MQGLLISTVHADNKCPPAFIACKYTAREMGKTDIVLIIINVVLVVIQSTDCCNITIPDDNITIRKTLHF
jgi:hypothetical protein